MKRKYIQISEDHQQYKNGYADGYAKARFQDLQALSRFSKELDLLVIPESTKNVIRQEFDKAFNKVRPKVPL